MALCEICHRDARGPPPNGGTSPRLAGAFCGCAATLGENWKLKGSCSMRSLPVEPAVLRALTILGCAARESCSVKPSRQAMYFAAVAHLMATLCIFARRGGSIRRAAICVQGQGTTRATGSDASGRIAKPWA